MASAATAKQKFVNSVTSDLAVKKMTTKLSTYLGQTVDETSGPVRDWKKIMKDSASELFDKCYKNMQAAYKPS
jgi:hypothetical protein